MQSMHVCQLTRVHGPVDEPLDSHNVTFTVSSSSVTFTVNVTRDFATLSPHGTADLSAEAAERTGVIW